MNANSFHGLAALRFLQPAPLLHSVSSRRREGGYVQRARTPAALIRSHPRWRGRYYAIGGFLELESAGARRRTAARTLRADQHTRRFLPRRPPTGHCVRLETARRPHAAGGPWTATASHVEVRGPPQWGRLGQDQGRRCRLTRENGSRFS